MNIYAVQNNGLCFMVIAAEDCEDAKRIYRDYGYHVDGQFMPHFCREELAMITEDGWQIIGIGRSTGIIGEGVIDRHAMERWSAGSVSPTRRKLVH